MSRDKGTNEEKEERIHYQSKANSFYLMYKAEKERADRAIQERKQFNQVYEMLLKKFKESEAREQKLREGIEEALRDATKWENPYEGYNDLQKLLASLYPKEETKL